MEKNEVIIATRGSKELHTKLLYHAKAQDLTASQVMRKLLREWVAEQEKKQGSKQLTLEG